MKKKILIIGGIALGSSAATRLRSLNEKAEIIIVEKDDYVAFATAGLPYYLGDIVKDSDELIKETSANLKERYNIDVRVNSEAMSIDRSNKVVSIINNVTNQEYTLSYDYLILAPGAQPIIPEITGLSDTNNVFTIRNVLDIDKIKDYIEMNNIKKVCVVGAGYLGLETAENLHHLNLEVCIINQSKQVLNNFDNEMAKLVENEMVRQGIEFCFERKVKAFLNHGHTILLDDDKSIETDLVILALGVKANTKLAKDAGLRISKHNEIRVNRFNQTNDKNIYAGGDAVEVNHYVSKKPTHLPLTRPAIAQANIIAQHIDGQKKAYQGSVGSNVLTLFDCVAASTGLSEYEALALSYDAASIIVHQHSKEAYLDANDILSLKLIYDLDTKQLLGAQAFGKTGVEKRVDVLATALFYKASIDDLSDYQLTFSPMVASSDDIINLAGYAAQNLIAKKYKTFQALDVDQLLYQGTSIIDLRSSSDFVNGSFNNAINIPINELRTRLNEINKSKDLYLACFDGQNSFLASQIIKASGFKKDIYQLNGGYYTYQSLQAASSYQEKTQPTIVSSSSCLKQLEVDLHELKPSQHLEVCCDDLAFFDDVKAFLKPTNHQLEELKISNNKVYAKISKGVKIGKEKQSIIVFSNELDRLTSTFLIANARLEQGYQVDLLFTFWGLSILRKDYLKYTNKSMFERFIGFVLPHGSKRSSISKHNYLGLGAYMMKYNVEQKNLESLDFLMEKFIINGGTYSACSYSMELLGFKKEELIENVQINSMYHYLENNSDSISNLFI